MEKDSSQVDYVYASSFRRDSRYELHGFRGVKDCDLECISRIRVRDSEEPVYSVRVFTEEPCGCIVDEEKHSVWQQLVQLLVGMAE